MMWVILNLARFQNKQKQKQNKTTKLKSRDCFSKCGREKKARMWLYRVLPNVQKE